MDVVNYNLIKKMESSINSINKTIKNIQNNLDNNSKIIQDIQKYTKSYNINFMYNVKIPANGEYIIDQTSGNYLLGLTYNLYKSANLTTQEYATMIPHLNIYDADNGEQLNTNILFLDFNNNGSVTNQEIYASSELQQYLLAYKDYFPESNYISDVSLGKILFPDNKRIKLKNIKNYPVGKEYTLDNKKVKVTLAIIYGN